MRECDPGDETDHWGQTRAEPHLLLHAGPGVCVCARTFRRHITLRFHFTLTNPQ